MLLTFIAHSRGSRSSRRGDNVLHFAPLGVQHAEFRRVAHLDLTSGRSRHGQALTCLPQLLLVVLWISSLQSLSERSEPQQLRWLCGVIDSQKRLSSVLSAESNKRVSALCRQYRSGIFFQFCSAWLTAALCDVRQSWCRWQFSQSRVPNS